MPEHPPPVTEILLLNNSTRDRIDSRNLSFDKILPKEIKNFRMLRQNNGKTIEHQIEENVLKIKHIFPIGNTQIIYQYDLQAWFGILEIIREFNQSLEIVSVFTPVEKTDPVDLLVTSVQLVPPLHVK